jgi:hypothetical protein
MTLKDPDRLDIVEKSPQGEIVFVIVALGDWSADADMLGQMKAKLRHCVSFAGSEQYTSQYATAMPRIVLSTTHALSSQADELVRQTSAESGIPIDVHEYAAPPPSF